MWSQNYFEPCFSCGYSLFPSLNDCIESYNVVVKIVVFLLFSVKMREKGVLVFVKHILSGMMNKSIDTWSNLILTFFPEMPNEEAVN